MTMPVNTFNIGPQLIACKQRKKTWPRRKKNLKWAWFLEKESLPLASSGRKKRFIWSHRLVSCSPPSRRVPMASIHSSVIATADIKGIALTSSTLHPLSSLRFKPSELSIFPNHRRVVLKGMHHHLFFPIWSRMGELLLILGGRLLSPDICVRASNKGAVERSKSSSCIYY